jgi:hypothetical protein
MFRGCAGRETKEGGRKMKQGRGMKRIEKLAEEWWLENRRLNLTGDGTFSEEGAFLAGYRQALEDAEGLIRAHGASKTLMERLRALPDKPE